MTNERTGAMLDEIASLVTIATPIPPLVVAIVTFRRARKDGLGWRKALRAALRFLMIMAPAVVLAILLLTFFWPGWYRDIVTNRPWTYPEFTAAQWALSIGSIAVGLIAAIVLATVGSRSPAVDPAESDAGSADPDAPDGAREAPVTANAVVQDNGHRAWHTRGWVRSLAGAGALAAFTAVAAVCSWAAERNDPFDAQLACDDAAWETGIACGERTIDDGWAFTNSFEGELDAVTSFRPAGADSGGNYSNADEQCIDAQVVVQQSRITPEQGSSWNVAALDLLPDNDDDEEGRWEPVAYLTQDGTPVRFAAGSFTWTAQRWEETSDDGKYSRLRIFRPVVIDDSSTSHVYVRVRENNCPVDQRATLDDLPLSLLSTLSVVDSGVVAAANIRENRDRVLGSDSAEDPISIAPVFTRDDLSLPLLEELTPRAYLSDLSEWSGDLTTNLLIDASRRDWPYRADVSVFPNASGWVLTADGPVQIGAEKVENGWWYTAPDEDADPSFSALFLTDDQQIARIVVSVIGRDELTEDEASGLPDEERIIDELLEGIRLRGTRPVDGASADEQSLAQAFITANTSRIDEDGQADPTSYSISDLQIPVDDLLWADRWDSDLSTWSGELATSILIAPRTADSPYRADVFVYDYSDSFDESYLTGGQIIGDGWRYDAENQRYYAYFRGDGGKVAMVSAHITGRDELVLDQIPSSTDEDAALDALLSGLRLFSSDPIPLA